MNIKNIVVRARLANESVRTLIKYRRFGMFSGVAIETNKMCNRKCPYCPNYYYSRVNSKEFMPARLVCKIVDELSEIDYSSLLEFGVYNEPLTDGRLEYFVMDARKKLPKAFIRVITNGDYLTEDKYNSLLKVGLDEFMITQHGDKQPKIMDKHRKKIRFMTDRQYCLVRDRCGIIPLKNRRMFKRCPDKNNLVITYTGEVPVCTNDYLVRRSFGNVKEKTIMDIWYSKRFKNARRKINSGDLSMDICRDCGFSENNNGETVDYIKRNTP